MSGKKTGAAEDRGDGALRAGVTLPPPPAAAFDRRRWELGASARAAGQQRRPMAGWMAAAAVVAAAAVAGPSLVHSYYHRSQHAPATAGRLGTGLVLGQGRASTAGLSHVWMEADGRGWAMGAPGEILATRDGGQHWTNVSPLEGAGAAGAFQARSATDAWWAVANAKGVAVYHTHNGGRTWRWTEIAGPARPAGWRLSTHALALGPAGTAYLLVASSWYGKAGSPPAQPDLLWSTHNGGQTWSQRLLRGFSGATEDAGSLFAAPRGRLLLESAGRHHLWISGPLGRRGPWRAVPFGGGPAQLVGAPRFYGSRGVWMDATATPGAPVGQDRVRVLTTSTGGTAWAPAIGTWGIRPVLTSVGPNAWTGATLEPGMGRAGGQGPPGQYFGGGPHALLRWIVVLRPKLGRAAVVQQLDFVSAADQWALVDVGSRAELWRSPDGGRQWVVAFSGVNPAAP